MNVIASLLVMPNSSQVIVQWTLDYENRGAIVSNRDRCVDHDACRQVLQVGILFINDHIHSMALQFKYHCIVYLNKCPK